ncbi:hypothetical protein Rhe02_15860 [Rhizocola hellebori]|uniref:Uncharacterized protein n=1 Tax=Rhizocola hellebori TaxID=1392758 RepID=A0A8J3VDF2_9ACTN|nr:hypothetical protein Rhe02_15860 [Rhizocola hellebori]
MAVYQNRLPRVFLAKDLPPRHPKERQVSTDHELDTADLIDPMADDPTPTEIADAKHDDYVESYPQATPIGEKAP